MVNSIPLYHNFNSLMQGPVRGKEASFNATRQSFVSVVSEDSETLCRDPLRANPSSPAAPQFMETNLSEMEDMKVCHCNKLSTASCMQ